MVFYAPWYDEWWSIGWKVIFYVNPSVITLMKGLFLYALVILLISVCFKYVENYEYSHVIIVEMITYVAK